MTKGQEMATIMVEFTCAACFFLSFIYFFCFSLTLWCQEVKVIVGSLPYYRKHLEGTAAVNWHYINETDLELNLVKSILIMILTPSLSHSKMGELKKKNIKKKTRRWNQ